jgi:sugar (pentulose or hexulose) kinase
MFLGLDVGTTSVKAAVINGDGRELSHARVPTPWRPVPTGAELDPDALLSAALEAAGAALRDAGGSVHAVGVASMAETGVLADGDARPVVPSIAWYDTRGEADAERIAVELRGFPERTGQPATSMCTLAKYAWMRAHWPEAARGTRWINVAEWIVLGLGGELGAEASLASRTGFYDLHTGAGWEPALAWADAPAGLVPPHAPAGTPLGRVTALPGAGGAVLAVAGHDHLAAAVGTGAAGEGDVLDSCGTAEAILRATAPLPPDAVRRAVADGFTVGRHAVAGRYVLQGAVWSGEALQAVLDLLGVATEDRGELEAAALALDHTTDLSIHGVDTKQLTVTGLAGGASPAALYLATLDAVGAAGADVLERMQAIAGPARRLVVTGGWAEGVAARAIKRRHLGPFEHSPAIFAGCRGAAITAARAAGVQPGSDPT